MRSHQPRKRIHPQRGAVLIVSLLLLLVMTLLGLGASQSTRLQERMAGNQRDLELAMQGAEASLRAAEALLAPNVELKTCATPAADCGSYKTLFKDGSGNPLDLAKQIDSWWTTNAKEYGRSTDLATMAKRPQLLNEYSGEVRDTLSQGGSYISVVRDYYRSTARSSGMTQSAQVIVQSTYSRVGFE